MQSNLILVFILSATKLSHEHFGSFADALDISACIKITFSSSQSSHLGEQTARQCEICLNLHVPLYIQLKETIIQIFGKSNQDGFTFVVTHHRLLHSFCPLFTGLPVFPLDIKIAQAGSPSTSSKCICWLTAHQASSPLVHIFLCAAGTCESQQKLCTSGLLLSHSLRSVCSTSTNNSEIIMPVKQSKSRSILYLISSRGMISFVKLCTEFHIFFCSSKI